MASLEDVRRAFHDRFGTQPRIFRAPGRVNLIGEHTDYNDGYVMPAAIQFSTWVAATPRDDGKLVVLSLDYSEERTADVSAITASPSKHWGDYVFGVAAVLNETGNHIPGANIVLGGDVPIGAGLSSSASIEVATGFALLGINGAEADRVQLAKLCQRAENEYVGARCGIMDQFVSANGRAGRALMLDCRCLTYKLLPLPDDVAIVICNSMVKHQLSGGEYNVRRAECEEGVRILKQWWPKIAALRDVTAEQLEEHRGDLPEVVYRRCRHVVSENARVLAMAEALATNQLSRVGELMAESHRSLRDDYQVSCAELDILVELANAVPGTVGSRMTGGGFGGCTVNLVRQDAVAKFRAEVSERYARATGRAPEIYVSVAADGANEVT